MVRILIGKKEKRLVKDYLSSNTTKQEIWKKYTGQDKEHGQIKILTLVLYLLFLSDELLQFEKNKQ